MAYNEDLDKAVERSSAALRAYQAANPVISTRAREPDIVTDPMQQIGFGGDRAGVIDLNATGAPGPSIGQSIDARTNALIAARDAPVIAQDALVERPAGSAPGQTNGPISSAASDVTQSVPVPQATQDLVASAQRIASAPVSTVPGNPNYKADYAMMRANERQDQADFNEGRARQLAFDNVRAAAYDAKIATENAARGLVNPSKFDKMVTHASTVAAGGRGGDTAQVIRSGLAPGADAVIRQVESLAPKSSSRNFAQEAIEAQKAEQARLMSGTTQQTEQLKLEQQKRLNDLGAKLAAAQDPKERERLSSTLLSLMGKDKPEDYQVIHVPGAESIGPDGMTKLKGQGAVIFLNKRTGARDVLHLDAQAAQGAPQGGPAEGSTGMAGGKPVVFKNGKWERA